MPGCIVIARLASPEAPPRAQTPSSCPAATKMTRIITISSSIPATEGGTPLRKGVVGKGDGGSVAEAPERFCRNCGHQLSPEDQFCPICARPVHETATVPTPEADVPVPPPPQTGGAGGAAAPQQPAHEGGGGRRWRPILVGSLGVFVVLVAAIITQVTIDLYGKGFPDCNETAAEQKGPKGKIGQT